MSYRVIRVANKGATSEQFTSFTHAVERFTELERIAGFIYLSLQGRTPDGRWEILDEKGIRP